MNQSARASQNASKTVVSSGTNRRLTGIWLTLVRIAWLMVVIPCVGLFIVSIPVFYQQVQILCAHAPTCPDSTFQIVSTTGMPPTLYALLNIILNIIMATIWYSVSFVLFWRRSDDWVALLASFLLVVYQITYGTIFSTVLGYLFPILTVPFLFLGFLGNIGLGLFFLFFPDGHLVPRWTIGILVLLVVNAILSSTGLEDNWNGWLTFLVNLALFGPIIFAQIYRYRHVSTPVQRQQTKWVISGFTLVITVVLTLVLIAAFDPALSNTPFWNAVWEVTFSTALLAIPLSIGFSILRYRLYDIDTLINRTLVYGTLTTLLALVYFGLVVGSQALLHLFTDQAESPAIVVVSTLVIAALFQPLRQRIQVVIDRRFYRSKYDAARTVQAFSATLSTEVNLSQLSEHLLRVVQETMQPTHLSLWLHDSAQEKKSDTSTEM